MSARHQASKSRRVPATAGAVLRQFGATAHQFQSLEYTLANVLAQVFGPGPTKQTSGQVRKEIEANFRKSAGTLRSELARVLGGTAPLVAAVAKAVARRNFLAHHFFRERAAEYSTPQGRRRLVRELVRDQRLFFSVDRRLLLAYRRWLLSHGVSREEIDAVWPMALLPRKRRRG